MIKRFGFILALLFVVVIAGCKKTEYKLEGPTTVSIVAGGSKELTLSVTPETSIKDVTFTVDKTSVVKATLNQTTLKVEGITAGSATITVTLKEKTHTIDVTVTEPEKAHEEKTILELLQGGKNDEKVIVTGVVYGIAQNGFYLEDSETGKIYVTLKTSKDLNVGDKIKLKAEYGLVGGFPRLKNAEVVETLEPVTDFGKPVIETTIKDLQTLDRTNKVGTYANVFEITGTLIKTLGGAYQLVDEEANNVLFTEISNVELFEGKESNRYAIKVVLHNFNMVSNKWEVSFVGTAEDIVEKPITLEELLPVIQSDIDTIPTHIYGNLPLPTTHPTLPFVSYSFSVETNAYMSIVDGEALFDLEALKASEATDLDIILKVNVATETEQREIDYPITLHAIKEQTLSNLLENGPEVNYSYVIVSGRVLAFTRNQSLSIRSYIVEDPLTKETTTIDFDQVGDYILHTSEDYLKVKVGDDIVVHGQYRNISRESVLNVTKVDVISSNNEVNHDIENAYVLKDEASYEELGLNYEQYLNKLVKIERPYFTYSTSTTPTQTNWVRIYHSEEPQVYDKSVNKRYFAFLIAAQSENLGNDRWMEWFDIPYVSGPAIQTEVSFYAYLLYPSATYLQFVIPSLDEILFSLEDRINNILDTQIPVSIEPGEFVDLNKHEDLVDGGITWSVSLPLIDLTTGEVADVSENTVVTLTATFNDGTKEVTLTRDITILLPKTHQVSEVVANAQDGQTIRAVGHFIGYFSDGNNNGVRGLILKDAVTSDIVFINDSSDLLGAYGQSKINDTELQIGDEVYIKGEFVVNGTPERREFIVNASTELEIRSSNNELLWPEDTMIVISNQAEMVAFFENPTIAKIIKFVGTESVPFAFGGSSSDLEKINYKFSYVPDATSNDEIKYPNIDGKLVSFKNLHNRPNGGATWWVDLFGLPENGFVSPNATNSLISKHGTFYGVYSAQTSTYHQMNLVNTSNFDIYFEPVPLVDQVEEALNDIIPASVNPGDTINLPSSLEDLVSGITWSVEPELVNLDTGLVSEVSEITNVTLTASFLDGETPASLEFVVSIVPVVIEALTVSQVIEQATPNDTLKVKGVVAGFYWNGSSSLHNDITHGMILRDPANNNMLYITGLHSTYGNTKATYKIGEVTISKGDELEFFADYKVSEEPGYIGRKELNITSVEAAQLTILNNNVSLTWNLTDAIAIQSNEALSQLAENIQYGTIYKLTGSFGFRGSASNYGPGINFVPGYSFTAPADFNHTVSWHERAQRFSIKFDGNAHNLGPTWWESALNVTADNYSGTASGGHLYEPSSEIYFIAGSLNPTAASGFGYIQLAVLDASWVNATRILP